MNPLQDLQCFIVDLNSHDALLDLEKWYRFLRTLSRTARDVFPSNELERLVWIRVALIDNNLADNEPQQLQDRRRELESEMVSSKPITACLASGLWPLASVAAQCTAPQPSPDKVRETEIAWDRCDGRVVHTRSALSCRRHATRPTASLLRALLQRSKHRPFLHPNSDPGDQRCELNDAE